METTYRHSVNLQESIGKQREEWTERTRRLTRREDPGEFGLEERFRYDGFHVDKSLSTVLRSRDVGEISILGVAEETVSTIDQADRPLRQNNVGFLSVFIKHHGPL